MNKYLLYILLILPIFGFSQKDTIAHLYTFGSVANDVGEDICATDDGGFAIIGSTASSGTGNTDIYFLKVDSLCNYQWSFALGGTNNDWGYAIKQTYDKGFIIAASTNSYGNGGYDAMLLKRDSLGNYQWQKTYGGNDWDFAYDVVQTFDSGYVFCGETYNNSAGFSDVYVVKINSIGDTLWTKTVGGSLIDKGNALIQTSDSNIVVAGIRNTPTDSTQAYVLKFDKDGTLIWDSVYGGVKYEDFNGIIETYDGGFVSTGTSTNASIDGDEDYYVLKIDRDGIILWEQIIGSIGDEVGYDILELANTNLFIIGYTEATGGGGKDAKLFLLNSGGWWAGQNSSFGNFNDEVANSVVFGNDGSMKMAGFSDGYGYGLYDLMVISVDTVVPYQQFTVTSNEDIAPISVQEYSRNSAEIKIFPNPTNDIVQITTSIYPLNLELIDVFGKRVLDLKLTQSNDFINIKRLSKGYYSMIFTSKGEVLKVKKLIVVE